MPKPIKIEFIIHITNEEIDEIMEIAKDGAAHWCDSIEKPDNGPFQYIVHNRFGDRPHHLTYDLISVAVQDYLENPTEGDFLEFVDHTLKIDMSYIDNEIADTILQYAVFGHVVYKGGVKIWP